MLLLYFDQAGENFLPSRATKEIVIHEKQRLNSMIADRIAHPSHDGIGLTRTHRAAHNVLDAAIGAGERATTRRIERSHRRVEETCQVSVVDYGKLRIGNYRHDDIILAGFRADTIGYRVIELKIAAEKILNYLAPQV